MDRDIFLLKKTCDAASLAFIRVWCGNFSDKVPNVNFECRMMKYVENTFTFLRGRWVQLGKAFLFIKPVCASPPALFKRGSQTLALAYLIFAPLPTSWKMGARTSRPLEVTKRNLFAGIFLCKRSLISSQEIFACSHLKLSQPSEDTKSNFFAQDKYQRTSGVTSDKAQFFLQNKLYFATASKKVKHLMREVSSQK